MGYYLGVDGGGTKTTAVVADETGKLLASVCGKSINYYSNPYEVARQNFRALIEQTGVRAFSSAVIGMSALSERADDGTAADFVRGILTAEHLVMTSDVEIALNSTGTDGARAVLICGTGSMAAAVDGTGRQFHAGGWGYLLGDEGSGYAVALNAIRKVLAHWGDLPEDPLTGVFRSFFRVDTESDILERFYDPPMPRDELAAFCKPAMDAYRAGSRMAREVVEAEAASAAVLAERILAKLPANAPLFLYGGLFEHDPEYVRLLNDRLPQKAGLLPYPPVIGALIDAARSGGITPDENFYHQINERRDAL